MRNKTFIIIAILALSAIAGVYFWDKQKKKYQPDVTPPEPLPKPAARQADQNVVELQNWLNGFDEIDPKLVVDGIFGPKTKAAFDKVNSFNQNNQLNSDDQNSFFEFQTNIDDLFTNTAMALTIPGMFYNYNKKVVNFVKGLFN